MQITLYKNCILNNSYSEVFFTEDYLRNGNRYNAFTSYLNSLIKKEIYIDNVYLTNEGKLTFEYTNDTTYGASNNIYSFNYMRILDDDNYIARYCFIDNIQIINGLCVITYSEDIWSNYSSVMSVRRGNIVNKKEITSRYPIYRLPMNYDGNNKLAYKSILNETPDNIATTRYVNVVFKIQFYDNQSLGITNKRIVKTCMFGETVNGQTSIQWEQNELMLSWITELIKMSSNTKAKLSVDGSEWFYEITEAYIIPSSFGLGTDPLGSIIKNNEYAYITSVGDDKWQFFDLSSVAQWTSDVKVGWLKEIKSITYDNTNSNYWKLHAFGTFTTLIPVIPNGTSFSMKLYVECDDYNFALLINVENKIYDISNDFKLEIPISVQSADITQQQQISRTLGNYTNAMKIVNGVGNIAMSVATAGMGSNLTSLAQAIPLTSMSAGQTALSYKMRGQSMQQSGTSGVLGGITSIGDGIAGLVANNKEMYTTNKSVNVSSNALLNSRYGLLEFYIDADNDTIVSDLINNLGYEVNQILIGDWWKERTNNNTTEYDIIKYNFIDLYGAFPQDICKKLKDIFLNGFRINYYHNV